MKTYLVIGSAGFIGSAIAKLLLNNGNKERLRLDS